MRVRGLLALLGIARKGPRPVSHPGLLAKAAKSRATPSGVGIVYSADGTPKITMDFVRNLTHPDRVAVDRDLASRGWKIHGDTVLRIE